MKYSKGKRRSLKRNPKTDKRIGHLTLPCFFNIAKPSAGLDAWYKSAKERNATVVGPRKGAWYIRKLKIWVTSTQINAYAKTNAQAAFDLHAMLKGESDKKNQGRKLVALGSICATY